MDTKRFGVEEKCFHEKAEVWFGGKFCYIQNQSGLSFILVNPKLKNFKFPL